MNPQDRQPLIASSPAEKEHIGHLASVLEAKLTEFAGTHGLARDMSLKGLALTIASAAPFASEEMLGPLAKAGLLIVMIDDLLDDPGLRESEIDQILKQVNEVVCGGEPAEGDNLGQAILDLRRDLEVFPLFGELYADWVAYFRRMIAGMVAETAYRPDPSGDMPDALPSLEDYLFYAGYSIGIPVYAVTAAIVLGDSSILEKREQYYALAEEAGRAVRLANDLATRKREEREKAVNAFAILMAEGQTSEKAIEEHIREDIKCRLERCRCLAAEVCTNSGKPERFMVDLALVVCGFYGLSDF